MPPVSPLEALAVVVAGTFAGGINTLVGSGTLVTFPTLVAVGLPPLVANTSNALGLVPGSLGGAWGYRRELVGQGRRLLRLGSASVCGALVGAVLLLVLPDGAFGAIVPVLIALACVLVLLQPRIAARPARSDRPRSHLGGPLLLLAVFGTAVYGGYFGAAQGVLLIGLLGSLLDEPLQRVNAAKNVLAALTNGVAALLFAVSAPIDWGAAGLVAVGALTGGVLAGRYGRRLPAGWLRGLVVVIGVVAVVQLLAFD